MTSLVSHKIGYGRIELSSSLVETNSCCLDPNTPTVLVHVHTVVGGTAVGLVSSDHARLTIITGDARDETATGIGTEAVRSTRRLGASRIPADLVAE